VLLLLLLLLLYNTPHPEPHDLFLNFLKRLSDQKKKRFGK
jgi:hypothetical protein